LAQETKLAVLAEIISHELEIRCCEHKMRVVSEYLVLCLQNGVPRNCECPRSKSKDSAKKKEQLQHNDTMMMMKNK
jgi:hypothetical protein